MSQSKDTVLKILDVWVGSDEKEIVTLNLTKKIASEMLVPHSLEK